MHTPQERLEQIKCNPEAVFSMNRRVRSMLSKAQGNDQILAFVTMSVNSPKYPGEDFRQCPCMLIYQGSRCLDKIIFQNLDSFQTYLLALMQSHKAHDFPHMQFIHKKLNRIYQEKLKELSGSRFKIIDFLVDLILPVGEKFYDHLVEINIPENDRNIESPTKNAIILREMFIVNQNGRIRLW